jgi:RNA 3'-terminal phosphate cyclase
MLLGLPAKSQLRGAIYTANKKRGWPSRGGGEVTLRQRDAKLYANREDGKEKT